MDDNERFDGEVSERADGETLPLERVCVFLCDEIVRLVQAQSYDDAERIARLMERLSLV